MLIRILDIDIDKGAFHEIGNIKWNGHELSFSLKDSASGLKADYAITPVSSKKFIQKITIRENWNKVPESEACKLIEAAGKAKKS